MSAEGMIRVVITEPDSNVVHLTVACPTHARAIVMRSGSNHRFMLSPIHETDRRCDQCVSREWPAWTQAPIGTA